MSATPPADPSAPAPTPPQVDKQLQRERRAWYAYDWADSGYVAVVGTVLFAPYLTSVAETAACGAPATQDNPCLVDLHVLGIPVAPGSLAFYVATFATIVSAILLPVIGAIADRSRHKKNMLGYCAWIGSAATVAMFFIKDGNWQLGASLLIIANIALGCSLVVYSSLLIDLAGPDERDQISSRGWSFGYLGSFTSLLVALGIYLGHDALGISSTLAVRISLAMAGVWWGCFTIIPFRVLRNREPKAVEHVEGSLLRSSFGQLFRTLKHMRRYPMTLLFLAAYLFFNDGIQTVIAVSSTYGEKQLGFATNVMIVTILVVQMVAFIGARLFGWMAASIGARRTILTGLMGWIVIVILAYLTPARQVALFLALASLIGIVLGGCQALSRSAFSQLIPAGREAEYFSLYQACERGTSWLGTFVFGLVHQITGSYRPAITALGAFFVIGALLLWRVDMRRGIRDVGNQQPTRV